MLEKELFNSVSFIISDGVNTSVITKDASDFGELETKMFTISNLELGNVAYVKSVQIVPAFEDTTGKIKQASVIDDIEFSNKQILQNLGAISWWRFEGDAQDEIGENHGTINGNIIWNATGKYGGAYEFDAANEYIRHNFADYTIANDSIGF